MPSAVGRLTDGSVALSRLALRVSSRDYTSDRPARRAGRSRALPPVVASFHIPKLWGFVPTVVVTMASWCGPSSGEGLVRVVRFDAGARSRRGDDASGATRSDAVSPQNGIDGAQTRL